MPFATTWMDLESIMLNEISQTEKGMNEIMPCAATWMDPEIIILSKVSQKEKDKHRMISLICGI